MFRYYMKLGAELVQLMDKFVPLSRIGIFRNERTRSTPFDEDIPPNDTPMPTLQQGPMTRARARELNYQVNSFLAVHKPSSMNGVLLNSCDAFLILRNLGHEPDWRESKHDKKASVDDQIGPYQFGPPGRGNFGRP